MWDQRDYRFGIGASLSLPIHGERLRGGIEEAQAGMAEAVLEQEHMRLDIRVEVVEAVRRLEAAEADAAVMRDQLLPTLATAAAAARQAFTTNQEPFAGVIKALRAERSAEVRYQQALGEASRRRAALLRAIGRLPIPIQSGAQP